MYLSIDFLPKAGVMVEGINDTFHLVLTCGNDALYFNSGPNAGGAQDGIDVIFPVGYAPSDLTTAANFDVIQASVLDNPNWEITYHQERHYWRITANTEQKLDSKTYLTICFANVKCDKVGPAMCSCTLLASVETTVTTFRLVSETIEAQLNKRARPKIISFSASVVNTIDLPTEGFIDINMLELLDTIAVDIRPYVCPPDPPGPHPPPPPPTTKNVKITWQTTDAEDRYVYVDQTLCTILNVNSGSTVLEVASTTTTMRLWIISHCLWGDVTDAKTITL